MGFSAHRLQDALPWASGGGSGHPFSKGPVEIVPGLFLGSCFRLDQMPALGIENVLTVLNKDLAEGLTVPARNWKVLDVADVATEDIAQHLPAALAFIQGALDRGEKVYVHCFAGISRSSTVVVAYLMQQRRIAMQTALEELRKVYPQAFPNPGFQRQLERWGVQGGIPKAFEEEDVRVRCRGCREVLADGADLDGQTPESVAASTEEIFIEAKDWMNAASDASLIRGKLYCPKCKAKVGSWDWSGARSRQTGKWVTPAFRLNPAKVDVHVASQQPALQTATPKI